MKLAITDIAHLELMDERFAFGVFDPDSHIRPGENRNPELLWRDVPDRTRSLVLVCVDQSVPSKPDDVNKEGREIPADLPRVDFYHWVMVDIPPDSDGIAEGVCSEGITPRGKRNPAGLPGSRQGLNDYTAWFKGDTDMDGAYFGYDGPCPPWNDTIPHKYHFVLFATDLERCPVEGAFTGQQVMDAIQGHILSEVRIVGIFSNNPEVTSWQF